MATEEPDKVSEPADKAITAGARLAAQKAAKAAKKAAARGKSGDRLQKEAARRAVDLSTWMSTNRKAVLVGVAVAVVALGGLWAWHSYTTSNREQGGALLEKAIEIENAPIVEAGSEAESSEEPTPAKQPAEERLEFASAKLRNEKALEAFRRVLRTYSDSVAGHWARLGEGRTLLAMTKAREARTAFEAALRAAAPDEVEIRGRAIEGIAFTYEAEQQWDQALRRYDELARLDRDAFGRLARYHQGRVKMAKGDVEGAKVVLTALLDDLQSLEAESTGPSWPFTKRQVELRVTELDPTRVPRGGAGPGGPGGQMGGSLRPGSGGFDQEQLQKLIEQLQAQGATKAGGGFGPRPPMPGLPQIPQLPQPPQTGE